MKNAPRDESLGALAALLDSLQQVISYGAAGKDAFLADRLVQDAVMYRILCAGEAAKRFMDAYEGRTRREDESRRDVFNADAVKVRLSDKQWAGLIGMRDALGHKIDEQDIEIVWKTVEHEIPLMVEPVWDALRWASMAWLVEERSPGRVAAKRQMEKEVHRMMQSMMTDMKALSLGSIQQTVDELSSSARALMASTRERFSTAIAGPIIASSAAIEAIEAEFDLQAEEERIALWIQENYDNSLLQDEASTYGPEPVIEEVITDSVSLDSRTNEWVAYLSGTISYEADGETVFGEELYAGIASGILTEDGDIEVVDETWLGPDRNDDTGEDYEP